MRGNKSEITGKILLIKLNFFIIFIDIVIGVVV